MMKEKNKMFENDKEIREQIRGWKEEELNGLEGGNE